MPAGLDVELVVRRGPMYERGALSRQDDLKKVGINIKITLLDTAGFRDRIEKGDFQAYTVLSGVTIDDPDLYYARLVCDSPRTWGNIVTRSLISSFRNRARRLMSRNGPRSRARWSACSCKMSRMTGGFTGNRPWRIGTV